MGRQKVGGRIKVGSFMKIEDVISKRIICPSCGTKKENADYSEGTIKCNNGSNHPIIVIRCLDCGFSYVNKLGYMILEDINILRENSGLKPLKQAKDTHTQMGYYLKNEIYPKLYSEYELGCKLKEELLKRGFKE